MLMPIRTMCVIILKTTQDLMQAGASSFAEAVATVVARATGLAVAMASVEGVVDGGHSFLFVG